MNRVQRTQRILWYELLAAAATEAAKRERDELASAAATEYTVEGTAPSWRMPSIGAVSSRVTRDSVDVVDPAALVAWVASRYPTEVESTVRPAFLALLRKTGEPDGDNVVDPSTGEIVPGLRYTPGGRFLGIEFRPASAAREVFGALAVEALAAAELAAGPAIGVQLAELDAGETPGHLDPGEVSSDA